MSPTVMERLRACAASAGAPSRVAVPSAPERQVAPSPAVPTAAPERQAATSPCREVAGR